MEAVIKAAKAVLREELDKVEVHPCDYHDDTVRAGRLYGPYRELWEAIAEQAKGQAAPVLAVKTPIQRYMSWHDATSKPDPHGDFVLFGDHVAALATCAEEARREGYEQGRFDEQMAQGPSREEWARIDAEKDAQPVAEAAAQEDDATEIACGDCGLTMAESRLLHELKHGTAAAPTAQPTPRVTPEMTQALADGEALLDRVEERRAARAQPTPPDDERAMGG